MVHGSAQALNSTGGEPLLKGCRTQLLLRASLAINAPQKKKKESKKGLSLSRNILNEPIMSKFRHYKNTGDGETKPEGIHTEWIIIPPFL
jgi:hypothetical protein